MTIGKSILALCSPSVGSSATLAHVLRSSSCKKTSGAHPKFSTKFSRSIGHGNVHDERLHEDVVWQHLAGPGVDSRAFDGRGLDTLQNTEIESLRPPSGRHNYRSCNPTLGRQSQGKVTRGGLTNYFFKLSSNSLNIRLYSSAQLLGCTKPWSSTGYTATDQFSLPNSISFWVKRTVS